MAGSTGVRSQTPATQKKNPASGSAAPGLQSQPRPPRRGMASMKRAMAVALAFAALALAAPVPAQPSPGSKAALDDELALPPLGLARPGASPTLKYDLKGTPLHGKYSDPGVPAAAIRH